MEFKSRDIGLSISTPSKREIQAQCLSLTSFLHVLHALSCRRLQLLYKVCGLKWFYNNHELASGENDNRLLVWNQHSTQPVLKYCEHTAAVKAIAWSPHVHGLLASRGGTTDRCIRFWNITTNSHLSYMELEVR
ncbi:hypothetical protein AHAS_Ahas11G0194400 [Arachis hypogaea]